MIWLCRNTVEKKNNKYEVRHWSKRLRNQSKFLKQYESDIVNKLRSECINLNGYKKFKYGESNGNCIYCNVEETMEHFILDCSGSKREYVNYHNENEMNYNEIRLKFRKDLSKIAIFFKEEKDFNIINLLFPNVWQNDQRKQIQLWNKRKECKKRGGSFKMCCTICTTQEDLKKRDTAFKAR